jgi:hypothetical protein
MAVNTINDLIALRGTVDQDATVLAAIVNDSPTSLASCPSEGLVTTRLGTDVNKDIDRIA